MDKARSFARLRLGHNPLAFSRLLQIQKLLQLGIMFPEADEMRYLDVGTGWGGFPYIMSKSGWSAYGLDDLLDGHDLQ